VHNGFVRWSQPLLLRLFAFVLLLFLVLWLIRSYLARSRGSLGRSPRGDEMVLDPQCQSYIPKREAIEAAGSYFCSRECAERFLAAKSDPHAHHDR
jgi:YHS domain-containing protein